MCPTRIREFKMFTKINTKKEAAVIAMESRDHLSNGVSTKNQMSRKNNLNFCKMRKVFLILIAVIGFGINANAQQLSSEQQAIINRQQAEIQQLRNSANTYQQRANDEKKACEVLRETLKREPYADGKSEFAYNVQRRCDNAAEYQKKANELYAKANEQERLLNEAIKKAKENARKSNEN